MPPAGHPREGASPPPSDLLLGRNRELAQLRAAAEAASAGPGQAVFIGGDPGVGKTRLTIEAAAIAADAGMRVAWGRCREEGGTPAHWAWVQILRALATDCDSDHLAAAARNSGGVIAAAVPEIAERLARPPRPGAVATPTRFAWFDAVESFLRVLSAHEPLALVLDDLHAADPSSLALLDFLAPELTRSRILLLATYREHEARTGEAGPVIARASRHGVLVRLGGLERADVAKLAATSAGRPIATKLIDAIHRVTEGNPLFVQEMSRALGFRRDADDDRETPRILELGGSIQHVIASRLQGLGTDVRGLLSAAAVIGQEFDVAMLEEVTGASAHEILARLQLAADAGVVSLRGGVLGRASFTHAAYRESFYTRLQAVHRSELHVSIARALEKRSAEAHLPEIAFHLVEAGPLESGARAARYAWRAGDQALARLAFAQAVRHFEDALRALETTADSGPECCDVLLRLADARFRAGEGEAAKEASRRAVEMARRLGDAERLASAALGLTGPWPMNGGIIREDVVRPLQDALAALGTGNDAVRATILARLAVEHVFDPGPNLEYSDESFALARRSRDPRALIEAHLARHYSRLALVGLGGRAADLREAERLARETGDDELRFRVAFQQVHLLFESGERTGLEREVRAAARVAERLRQPFYHWFVAAWRAALALTDGRLDAAERLIEETFASGRAVQGVDEIQQFAAQTFQTQLWNLRLEQGCRLEEVEGSFRVAAETIGTPVVQSALMLLHCAMGRTTEAADRLERFAIGGFAVFPSDWTRVPAIAFAADACAELGAAEHATALYDLARPYAESHMSNGSYYFGSMQHRLARLAASRGDVAEAHARFDAALRAHRRMGARCWIARTQAHRAELLLRHGRQRERARARRIAEEALARARELGMSLVEAFALQLLDDAAGSKIALVVTSGDARDHPRRVEEARQVLCREGGVFRIEWGGATFFMRHHRGLVFLARLLAHPGVELPALVLAADEAGSAARGEAGHDVARWSPPGDAGELIDTRARRDYRRRIADLEDELAVAGECHDIGRAALLREERERLEQELARAVGLGGRARRAGSHGERARINVTRAIKETLGRIERHSPELAQHLRETIKTGAFCVYQPDSRLSVRWET